MTETNETAPRDRSPAFPVVPLEAALARLAEFEAHYKRSAARPETVGEAWGIKTKAYADRIAAALRYFGLLEYQGSGKDRSIVISEEGRKYLRARLDETKQEVIKAAALRPKQLAKFWAEWGVDRPADAARLESLMLNHEFSESGARDFLKVYDATITYAKLSDSDKAPSGGQEDEDEPEAPPMTPQVLKPETTLLPPTPPKPGMRQEIITLDEGDVVLTFPANLTPESFGDLKAHLDLFIKKMQRRAAGIPPHVLTGEKPPKTFLGGGEDDEAAN